MFVLLMFDTNIEVLIIMKLLKICIAQNSLIILKEKFLQGRMTHLK